MKHVTTLLAACLIMVTSAMAQIPSGYYDSADGLTGTALKDELNDIIDSHTEYNYTHSTQTDVWDILKASDYVEGDATKVELFYTGWSRSAADEYDNGDGWVREHVWAKGHGAFGTSKGPGTDCHNLRPADNDVNTKKSNRWFEEGGTEYVDDDVYEGDGSTSCYFGSGSSWTWEPRDEVKGDVARMLFYMVVRYEGERSGEPDCELVDYLPTNNNEPSAIHALESTLLQWHLDDPVSAFEERRNNIVHDYQDNRNPFIDHPEWVCEIWGGTCYTVGEDVFISEYVEGSSYNKAIEVYNGSGASIDLSEYTIKKQTNGAGSWTSGYALSGTLASDDVYAVCHSSATSTLSTACDASTSNTALNFNGNDPVGLFHNGTLIDIVGTFDGGSSNFAANTTIVRKSTVTAGTTTYSSGDWDSYASNTFTDVGSHTGSPPASGASDLMISEYAEGSSYNKAIEIYNGTGSSVNLGSYSLKKNTNGGSSWSTTLTLSGTLADDATYVICHSSANSNFTGAADLTTSSSTINFNGNDPIGLFNGGTQIDVVGTFNNGSGNFAANTTLVRKATITDPSTTYAAGDWDSYSSDTYSYLGSHTYNGKTGAPLAQNARSLELTAFPNPFSSDVSVVFEGTEGSGQLVIFDLSGRAVRTVTVSTSAGQNQLTVEASDLPAGAYFAQLSHDGSAEVIRLMKN